MLLWIFKIFAHFESYEVKRCLDNFSITHVSLNNY